jgi:hypothetical protein
MDPNSQQPTQGYGPQQYGQQYTPQPMPQGQAAYSSYQQVPQQVVQPQVVQPQQMQMPQGAQSMNTAPQAQVYQPQTFYPQSQSQYQTAQSYPQTTAYNQYGQYSAQNFSSGSSGGILHSLKSKAVMGVAGFIVVVAGIFGIAKLSADSPNDMFYSALDNQLKLSSVHVVLSSSAPKLNSTTKVNYYVDYLDPSSPKSAGTVESAYAFLSTKSEVAAEFNANKNDVYVKFNTPSFENWILTTESDQQLLASRKATNLSQVRDLALDANSVFGVVMSGDFPKDIRSDAMKSIKNKSAYTITPGETTGEGDSTVRKYTVRPNRAILEEIQKSAADKLGATFQEYSDNNKDFSFYIDTKRKFITKIEQSDEESTYSITFSEQNQAFQATPPASSVTTDAYLSTIK